MGGLEALLKNMHRRHDYFDEITKGQPISFAVLGPKFDPDSLELLTRDPTIIKHFLKDKFEKYSKPEGELFWQVLRLWLGQGIFVASHGVGSSDAGENWIRQRKIAASIFNRANFNENMSAVFVSKGKRLCELLAGPASGKEERVDMQAMFFQYTMDSIMQIFFGEVVDTMGGQANKYAAAYDTAHRCLIEYFFTSIPALALGKLAPWPFGGVCGLAHKLHMKTHPVFREFEAAYATLDSESRRMVANCRNDPNLSQRKDLLALFVQQETSDGRMSMEWLRDVVLNFVIAGRDTTACTLSWMFYILATHPKIQQKLQDELDTKFPPGSMPTIQAVSPKELPYLNGVVYETLRLYPPVPSDGKRCMQDDVLPDGTQIPANTRMGFLIYAMGRDADKYPNPLEVKPERWIPFKEPSPFDFPVFQAGPRICLGMNMALFETKIAAAMVLREYSFKMAPGEADKISYLATALTMSVVNTKGTDSEQKMDSHNLWLVPCFRPVALAHTKNDGTAHHQQQ